MDIFQQLGFLDAEIKVYKALLKLGPSLVSKIQKETGLHRTHIYDLLEKLREKGLVSIFIESGKKHFQASPPSTLLSFLEEKKNTVKKILPELEDLMSLPKEETNIELFKGKNGLKSALQDVLRTKKDYCVMGSLKKFEEIIKYSFPHFLKEIEKNNIKERVLGDKKEKIIKIKGGKYKFLKGDMLFPSSFWVYGNKVIIFIWHLPYFAILIKNKDVAKTYKNYFDFFWNFAK
jgi:sugar-specific transcriptional regulator TrmB